MQIFAPPCDKFRIASNGAAAHRALAVNVLGETERRGAARPFRFDHLDHGRNHFAGFLDHNRVADSDVLALDFVFVVQCGAADSAAAHKHGF